MRSGRGRGHDTIERRKNDSVFAFTISQDTTAAIYLFINNESKRIQSQ